MDEIVTNQDQNLYLRGEFNFYGNPNVSFNGPIKKGLRLLFWGLSNKLATSCSFVNNYKINIGDSRIVEVVILSPQSIDKIISINQIYSIGLPEKSIGEFKIIEILGKWEGKVP